MSDAHHTPDHDSPHEGPIKTAKQLILAVFYAFVIPIIGIILLASYVATDSKPAAGSDGMKPEAIALRIKPVAGAPDVKDISDVSTLRTGEQVYTQQCASCHASGTLGAPKFGVAGEWAPRLPQGFDALLTSALKGKGAMAPQGADGDAVMNFEVARGLVYMANHSGAKFAEPAAPAAPAASAAQ
jgi:cytochrome c5